MINTPVTIISAISNAARNGVLFNGGVFVESLARVKAIAFDKTGTLTAGKPSVVAIRSVDCQCAADEAALGYTPMSDDLRRLPFALSLSRAARNTIWVNVFVSIAIKLIFFVLVLLGVGTMWMAVLADMGTSLLVTLNGMRLIRFTIDD